MDVNHIKKQGLWIYLSYLEVVPNVSFFLGIDIGVNSNNKLQRFKVDDFLGA